MYTIVSYVLSYPILNCTNKLPVIMHESHEGDLCHLKYEDISEQETWELIAWKGP